MSINENSSTVVHFIADGQVKEFNFPFRIFAKEDIDVYVNTVLISQGYDVEIEETDGGKVIFTQAPSLDSKITIIRNLEIKRTSDFQEGGAFRAKVINHELDYQVASLQQLDEKIERSMIYPPYGQEKPNLILPLPSSGKALVWNQEANGLENSTININDTISTIENYSNQAKESAIEAENQKIKSETFANQVQETADELTRLSEENLSNINQKLEEVKSQVEKAAEEAVKASQYAESASFGNIGDIKYTIRTDVPNGGAWCDGAEYTQAQFPDIYQMLVEGKLQKTDYETFSSTVSSKGYCEQFALDSSAQKFKVPSLLNKYVVDLNSTAPIKGNGKTLGLVDSISSPKLFGIADASGFGYVPQPVSGGFNLTVGANSNTSPGSTSKIVGVTTDSSKSGIIADTANLEKIVTLRPYVILYSSAAQASVAQAAEFINALTNKANTDFSNIADNIDYIIENYRSGVNWYRIYKSGWIEQGSYFTNLNSNYGINKSVVNFLKPFKDTGYTFVRSDKVVSPGTISGGFFSTYNKKENTRITCPNDNVSILSGFDWYACGYKQ